MSNAVNGQACSYVSLSNYNGVPQTNMQQSAGGSAKSVSIVPSFGKVGYPALSHGFGPSCSGYFDLTSAYGKGAENCNSQGCKM